MQDRDPSQDERVSRGPAEPDGGVSEERLGPGGRGAAAGEQLEPLEQQAGLDAPYGSRTADQESGAIDQGKGKPAAQQRQPGDVGSGQGETPGKVAGTQL
jgi:hypothetical protein